jgi:2-polyprenyl-3-methyl-5-hydroxy-6-metoxy-1,4-benzoquinol methylase
LTVSLKEEWNRRAEKNAFHYVSAFKKDWDEESFYRWGEIQTRLVIDKFFESLGVDPSGLTALEIGCGAGRMSRALASRFKTVFAYDFSEEYVSIAKKNNSHLTNVTFAVNDGVSFPEIENESFDFVFSGWTMQHMPTKAVVIKNIEELARVLRKNGVYKIDPATISSRTKEKIISKIAKSKTARIIAPVFGVDRLFLGPTWRGARFEEKELLSVLFRNKLSAKTLLETDGVELYYGKKVMRKWFYGEKL